MNVGLVLEGGGMRGLFTAGVMDVMMAHNLTFNAMIGVSSGATFGCNFKSHQPGRVLRYNLTFKDDPRYMGFRSFLRTGDFVGAEFSYYALPQELDPFDYQTFRQDPTEFHVVCTDVMTGKPIYHRLDSMDGKEAEWIRASASLPLLSRPVNIGDLHLLDGGISDSIPLCYLQSLGYEKCVVVLTQPKGFFKRKTRLMPLFYLLMHRYPAIISAMSRRHLMYNEELAYLDEQERQGKAIIISPQQELPIGRIEQDEHKMHTVYNLGQQAAMALIPKLRAFIS